MTDINEYNHTYPHIYYYNHNHHSLIYAVNTAIAFSYPRMSLQHPVAGSAAQVPDPDRVIQ